MKKFLKDPGACAQSGNPVVAKLIYGWGNEGYSALDEYLAVCIDRVLTTSGPTLECGSGLSTVLLGAIAKKRGQGYWALEHTPQWAKKVQSYLDKYKLDNVVLCSKPLKDYGDFCWYDVPLKSMPDSYFLVVCDGPPGDTKGGRYGLVPIMRERLAPGSVILLDDAEREHEFETAKRWEVELGAPFKFSGSVKPYIEMTLKGLP
jgi:predicted O-methyltransferase YrrM